VYRQAGRWFEHFNARSIRNKVGELAALVGNWDFDVVAISETWIEQG